MVARLVMRRCNLVEVMLGKLVQVVLRPTCVEQPSIGNDFSSATADQD